jgi:hypothetical protein
MGESGLVCVCVCGDCQPMFSEPKTPALLVTLPEFGKGQVSTEMPKSPCVRL